MAKTPEQPAAPAGEIHIDNEELLMPVLERLLKKWQDELEAELKGHDPAFVINVSALVGFSKSPPYSAGAMQMSHRPSQLGEIAALIGENAVAAGDIGASIASQMPSSMHAAQFMQMVQHYENQIRALRLRSLQEEAAAEQKPGLVLPDKQLIVAG